MRSDEVKKGPTRAPHRSLFYAMGYAADDLEKPLIGVVNAQNEVIPGHFHLDEIARAVKAGVLGAGGTPMEFPSIGLCDGIAMNHSGMNYSLASRELIADSIESMYMAYKFDGLVLIGNCDKIVPGMLMAAARLNVPCVYVSGGPMLPGRYNGEDSDLTMGGFEAVGAYTSGKIDDETLKNKEETACQTCGSCAGMYTANTINCLAEVLGIALPGNGTIPAPYGARSKRTSAPVTFSPAKPFSTPSPWTWPSVAPPTPCSISWPSPTRHTSRSPWKTLTASPTAPRRSASSAHPAPTTSTSSTKQAAFRPSSSSFWMTAESTAL